MDTTDSPLKYNGVVYNEMKGAYSSPDDVLSRVCMNSLFPTPHTAPNQAETLKTYLI